MRQAGLLALLLLLGACSSEGETEFLRAGRFLRDTAFPPEPPPPGREPTRAELDQIPFATIAIRRGEGPRSFVVPLANNGGYLSYVDGQRRGVVLRGGALAGTLGLGRDLDGVRHAADDPVAVPRPLGTWPATVDRSYEYVRRSLDRYQITLRCRFERGPRQAIEIVERRFEVVAVTEICRNAHREVVNRYFVDPETGFIWRSVQWYAPRQTPLTIEIIRPFAG